MLDRFPKQLHVGLAVLLRVAMPARGSKFPELPLTRLAPFPGPSIRACFEISSKSGREQSSCLVFGLNIICCAVCCKHR